MPDHTYTLREWRAALARDVFGKLNLPPGDYAVTHKIDHKTHAITLTLTRERPDKEPTHAND
jgi:hypothetical protein